MEKLPNTDAYSARSPMWEHLWMKSEDDPEARIRELERPLAETARVSEVGHNQPPPGYPYPPGPPAPPPPPPFNYGGAYPGTSRRSPSPFRALWILAPFLVIGVVALISYTAQRHSSGGLVTLSPTPSISPTYAAPSTGAIAPQPSTGAPSAASPSPAPLPPAGGSLSVAGIKKSQTVTCNESVVDVSGISNNVVIHGHCTSLSVSGVQNSVTVDAVDAIEVSGFNNQITFHTGSPSIDKAGDGNVVQQG
jgi:hypothetical protein